MPNVENSTTGKGAGQGAPASDKQPPSKIPILDESQLRVFLAIHAAAALLFAGAVVVTNLWRVGSTGPDHPDPATMMLLLMGWSGGLGASLCNLRGIFVYSMGESRLAEQIESGFPKNLVVPYHARTVTGVVTGVAVFFVAALAFSAFATDGNGGVELTNWTSPGLCYRYIGLAILAGFASKEFMQALKGTAEGIFGQRAQSPSKEVKASQADPKVPSANGAPN